MGDNDGFDHLRDPLYNLRQVCLEWALLEQHIADPKKTCPDCIRKHAITAEAYLAEALQLDAHRKHTAMIGDLMALQRQINDYIRAGDYSSAGAVTRQGRKGLLPIVF